MENPGRISARDISAKKLLLIDESARRLGISIIDTARQDAAAEAEGEHDGEHGGEHGGADIVLADVPCSGFGVIRRKPDIRYKTEQDVSSLPQLQKSILKGLSSYVRPGGVLLYSTCTVLKRENEDIINWFLQEQDQFRPEGFLLPGIGDVPGGMITLWPHIRGTDGFFVCKLRKVESGRLKVES